MSSPSISVVIPVKNEAGTIRACIEGVLHQSIAVDEIVVIDSGSTDGTLEILGEYATIKTISIAPEEFNHGETRNLGVREAQGEFVALTVGDARPASDQWIEELLKGFEDERVAGVCGQQVVPHDLDMNPAEWFRPSSEPQITRYRFPDPEAFQALSPREKKQACSWDDVTAMYRREVLLEHPFPRVAYGEDIRWARKTLLAGHELVYNPAARVYHYHERSFDYTFKRTLTTCYHRYQVMGVVASLPSLKETLLPFYILLREDRVSVLETLKWALYNVRIRAGIWWGVSTFRRALQQGDDALRTVHEAHCGVPPTPRRADAAPSQSA